MKIIPAIFIGIISAFVALVLEISISIILNINLENIWNDFSQSLILFLIVAVIIEELIKYLVISQSRYSILKTDSPKEIFWNSIFIGVGFAFSERMLNLFNSSAGGQAIGFENFSFLILLQVFFIHIITAGFIGWQISKNPRNILAKFGIVLIAISIHLAYNLLILYLN